MKKDGSRVGPSYWLLATRYSSEVNMAGLRFKVPIAATQTVANTTKTICQILAPSNQRVKILEIVLGFDGTSATDAEQVISTTTQTSAGTGGVSITPVKQDRSMAETVQASALKGPDTGTWTAEPTAGTVIDTLTCHPQQNYVRTFAYGCEDIVKGGERWAITVKTGTNTPNVYGYVLCEE